MIGSIPHVVPHLEAKRRVTICRWVAHHANRPILGPGKAVFRTPLNVAGVYFCFRGHTCSTTCAELSLAL